MPLVLDTHTLFWFVNGFEQLGPTSRQLIEDTSRNDMVAVSAITFWELALLQERNRIELPYPVGQWRQRVPADGVTEIPVTGDIGIAAVMLKEFHSDPADRIITATAIMTSSRLVTADQGILSWTGELSRHNASA
ncbi:MAG TPA: type II toxin-antitoxin system VapC family toxin [Dehalococcoidia bacterium]|nr:type II toxin-antitoxin system VapC family toxin [Dehalococcoidia bacterium]